MELASPSALIPSIPPPQRAGCRLSPVLFEGRAASIPLGAGTCSVTSAVMLAVSKGSRQGGPSTRGGDRRVAPLCGARIQPDAR